MIDAAWTCAARVYNPDTTEPASRLNVKREVYLQAAQSGTAKATEISLVTPAASGDQAELSSPCLPAILVAVRGTASTVDCMVNLNGRPNNILPLIVSLPFLMADMSSSCKHSPVNRSFRRYPNN